MSHLPKDNRSLFDRIWDVHPTEKKDNTTSTETAKDLKLLATVNVPLYILNHQTVASLKPGDKVQISPDAEHFMSRGQVTPALVVSLASVQYGVLDLRFGANLCPWLVMKETGVEVLVTVVSCKGDNEGNAEVTLKLDIIAPIGAKSMYLPRMRWALSKSQLDEFSWDTPQGPPPLWQVTVLRKHGLNTAVSATSSWMEEPSPLELYTSPGLATEMTAYDDRIPVKSELYRHQKQALWWALQQENPPLPTPKAKVQFWRHLGMLKGVFQNTLNRETFKAVELRACLGRGGLLADDMGLVRLLLHPSIYRPTIFSWQGEDLDDGSFNCFDEEDPDPRIFKNNSHCVLDTWKNEIEKHCPSLTYKIYHPGGSKVGHGVNFTAVDIVITNYDTVRNSERLSQVKWRRIVFDEAHYIRNHRTKTHKAVLALQAHARWALTGTPIINNLKDVGAIVAVLKTCEPLDDTNAWDTHIGAGNKLGKIEIANFKELLTYICLRRTKELKDQKGNRIVPLPKVTYQTVTIKLDQKQQALYDSVATSGKASLKEIINSRSHQQGLAENMLTVILRLRQVVLHPMLLPPDYQASTAEPQLVCFGCTEGISDEDGRIATCKHFFCARCAGDIQNCPCGAPGKLKTEPYIGNGEETDEEADEEADDPEETELPEDDVGLFTSAKLEALVALLKQISWDDKSLVFSSFVKFLFIVERRLSQEGIGCVLYHGKMSAKKRNDSILEFSKDNSTSPRVMLISLAAGALGLNLTMANYVFLMDPWWQPSIERQAVDRVNRIGQTKEVNVYRLVAQDTIEEKVLQIQANKTALINTVLSETKAKENTIMVNYRAWGENENASDCLGLVIALKSRCRRMSVNNKSKKLGKYRTEY